jgi:hypothetical protein
MDHDPIRHVPTEDRQSFTTAHWRSLDPDRPILEVTTRAPGLLVIADTWMTGWKARVDGLPVPILRGNHAQRVIPLTVPGHHLVSLEYHPPGWLLGCGLSALSALAWSVATALVICATFRESS